MASNPEYANYPTEVRRMFNAFRGEHLDFERDVLSALDGQAAVEGEEKLRALLEHAFYAGYHAGALSVNDLPEGDK